MSQFTIPTHAFTVQQPWAGLLGAGIKPWENRTWKLPKKFLGVPLFLHSSKTPLFSSYEASCIVRAAEGPVPELTIPEPMTRAGSIIAEITFSDCIRGVNSPWAVPGQWQWVVGEIRPVPTCEIGGQLGIWMVSPALAEMMRRLMEAEP